MGNSRGAWLAPAALFLAGCAVRPAETEGVRDLQVLKQDCTASAPVVAEVYQPGLAPVGLLLAVLGNIMGTYLGFVCSALCRFVNEL